MTRCCPPVSTLFFKQGIRPPVSHWNEGRSLQTRTLKSRSPSRESGRPEDYGCTETGYPPVPSVKDRDGQTG